MRVTAGPQEFGDISVVRGFHEIRGRAQIIRLFDIIRFFRGAQNQHGDVLEILLIPDPFQELKTILDRHF